MSPALWIWCFPARCLWRELRRGLHVGYYKGSTAGTWWLREYRAGKRPKRRLGVADDDVEADGVTVFSGPQVLVAALGGDRRTLGTSSTYTVNDALADYWLYRAAKSPALSVEIDESKAKAHLDEAMRVRPVAELKTTDSEAQRRAKATAERVRRLFFAALNCLPQPTR